MMKSDSTLRRHATGVCDMSHSQYGHSMRTSIMARVYNQTS